MTDFTPAPIVLEWVDRAERVARVLPTLDDLPSLGQFVPGAEVVEALEQGLLPDALDATTLDALVYNEYFDTHYTRPNTAKLIDADANEPPWDRRVPGCVLYAQPGEPGEVSLRVLLRSGAPKFLR